MSSLLTLATARAAALASPLSALDTAFFQSVERNAVFRMPGATLSGAWLSWLSTDREANAAVGMGGVRIQGDAARPAVIAGPWHAPNARAPFPLVFDSCRFDGEIDLSLAELSLLSFEATHTRRIDLRGAAIGWFRFRRQSVCDGGIVLRLARLERGADFTSSRLTAGPDGALSADWLRTNGPLNFYSLAPDTAPFEASGRIRLYGARIGGDVNLRSAVLTAGGDIALNMDQCTIEGSATFAGAKLTGALSLVGADIKGDLIAEGLVLSDGQFNKKRATSLALIGDHMRVAGSAYLRNGFHATGMVRFYGASIGCDLECHGATFVNPGQPAFVADGLRVQGGLRFAEEGPGAACHIEGDVVLTHAAIAGDLVWQRIEPVQSVSLELRSAKVTTLVDEEGSWPFEDRLDLHNFDYTAIGEGSPLDAASRETWLRRSRGFSHQAYDRLAAVLRQQGRYADARDIMFFKENRYATETALTLGDRWWYGVRLGRCRVGFGPLAGYGYRLKWAFVVMIATVLLCGALYMAGYPGLMTKTGDHAPEFQSFMYSFDVFVPIIDFGASAWIPDPNKGAVLVHGLAGDLRTGGLLLAAYWLEIALGWIVSSVLVGTITARLARS